MISLHARIMFMRPHDLAHHAVNDAGVEHQHLAGASVFQTLMLASVEM